MNCFEELNECTKIGKELINIVKYKDEIIKSKDEKINKIIDLCDLQMKEINNKWLDSHPNDNFKYYGQLEMIQEILKILRSDKNEM